ncbi:MAG TPA: hypothetical protein VJK52_05005 [Candidatus Nanoarchaeia archaeon]|nr:hypothetical protein [Candidatus Nanoarchaeia archaeon]
MREKTLFKIALVTSIAGLIILFFTLETIPVSPITLSQLRTEDIRKEVLIRGTITRITTHDGLQVLYVVSSESFPVMVFRDDAIPLEKGKEVEIRGTMSEYNHSKQFLGEEVRVI